MSILQIKEAGQEATLTIAGLKIVDGEFGKQVAFETSTGDTLYVTESSVLRQLDRTGAEDIAGLVGLTLRFSRAANKNPKFPPYWNIDQADDVPPPSNGKPIATKGKEKVELSVGTLPGDEVDAPAALTDPWAALVRKQRQCIAEALHDAQKMKELGLTADEIRSVFAGAATLLIQRSREGI